MRRQGKEKTKERMLVGKRKFWLWLTLTVVLLMSGNGIWDQVYAGEFGGFDIDIGTDEGMFDDWGDEPETEEPETDEPGTDGSEENPGTSVPEQEEVKNSKEGNGESADNNGMETVQEKRENNSDTANKDTGDNSNSNFEENNGSVDRSSFKNEEKLQDNIAEKIESSDREKSGSVQKKTKKTKIKITEPPKEEPLKVTAAGMALTAVGMTKISFKPQNYNNNENEKDDEKLEEKDNETIKFEHVKTVPANEYPEIEIIRSTDEMDVTILSLCLNGEEIFWHQQGDNLIFDQPVTEKKNSVRLLAVIDGSRIVQMPVWEF